MAKQMQLNLWQKLVVVLFAGAGGSCSGIEQAIGRFVDVAANHNPTAISCHQKNHPQCKHYIEDVRTLHPHEVCGGRPVGYLHLSPDCTHHSQAKGGQPRDEAIRSLAWAAAKWGGTVKPDVITLENVKEIQKWGRLIAKRDKATGRVIKLDGTVAAPGEVVPRREQFLVPDPKHAGKTWQRFLAVLRAQGYAVEVRILCAADYGVPTTRTRLFMVARRDGMPIVWPEPTHFKNPARGQKKWVAAHTCIDFSIESRSIFEREKPLAEATLRRVARGLKKFVLDCPEPFIVNNMTNNVPRPVVEPVATVLTSGHKILVTPSIVPVTHSRAGDRVHDSREPLPVVTTARRGEFAVATPVLVGAGGPTYAGKPATPTEPLGTVLKENHRALATANLVQMGYGEREGQAPRVLDMELPLGVATAGGRKHALVTAFVEQANGFENAAPAHGADEPLSTVMTKGANQRLVTAHLAHLRNNCDARDLQEPLPTASAGGQHHGLVEYHLSPEAEAGALRCASFLLEYYSEGGQWSDLRNPMNAATTRDRFALVTVWIKGDPYVIVDICLRMLTPRELANSMSFPRTYNLEVGHDGRRFTKSEQVFMIGNAVPPLLQRVVTAANYSDRPVEPEWREAA